jgi:transformation/transcription domain-associated protein
MLVRSLHSLLRSCPEDSPSSRKELILVFKSLAASYLKKSLFSYVNDIVEETYLLGPSCSRQTTTMRSLALSAIVDFLYQTKELLNVQQLIRVVHIFTVVLHDPSLSVNIHLSALLLLSALVDSIAHYPVVRHSHFSFLILMIYLIA